MPPTSSPPTERLVEKTQWPLPPLSEGFAWERVVGNPELETLVLNWVKEPLSALKQQYGYTTEDIVALWPTTPGLEEKLAPFKQEHHHTDDEVRIILHGSGVFGFAPPNRAPYTLHLQAGECIVIPAYSRHWFTLGEEKTVVALRVFKQNPSWVAVYEPLNPA
jgi:1,2-dihydroxy-3-keto-5-methylthiopentene dioxygenase